MILMISQNAQSWGLGKECRVMEICGKESYMKKLQNKNLVLVILTFGMVMMLIVWQGLVWNDTRIIKVDSKIKQKLDEGLKWQSYIDLVDCGKDNYPVTKDWITISGWLIYRGKSIDTASVKVVLKKVGTEDFYILPTTMQERRDVTEWIGDGEKYNWSGFKVKIPHKGKIDVERYDYEIYALYDLNHDGEKLVALNTTLKEWKKDE